MSIVMLFVAMTALADAPSIESYPDDAYSRPAIDRLRCFEHLCGLSIGGGNSLARAEAYHHNVISRESRDGVAGARWRFNRKAGQTMGAALNVPGRIRRPARSIAFTVCNDSDVPATFGLVLDKMPWEPGPTFHTGTWVVAGSEPVPPHGEKQVELSLNRAVATQETDSPDIRYPMSFYLRVEDAQSEVPYTIFLSDLVVHYPEADSIDSVAISGPSNGTAGAPLVLDVSCKSMGAAQALAIEWRDQERVLWRTALSEDEVARLRDTGTVSLARTVPAYLPPRDYVVGVTCGGYRVEAAETNVSIANGRHAEFPTVEKRPYKGRPRVFVDGTLFSWSGYASYEFMTGNVSEFGASGANVFVVPVAAGQHLHQIVEPTWPSPDEWDFGDLDERVGMALQANPDARLALRVSLTLPAFWTESHLEDRALVRTESGDMPWEETGTQAISIASTAWRDQQSECVRVLLDYCRSQPWADRVIAFIASCEVTEEWFAWGCNDGQFSDYSPPAQEYYRQWCSARNLNLGEIPGPAERRRPGWDWYPDDDAGRRAAAWAQAASDLSADTIASFARVVKEETRDRMLVGAFYGYVMQLSGEPRQHLAAQFAMDRLLDEPALDFFLGIPLHNFRKLIGGYDTYVSATDSIQAHGKIYLNENDLFSWLHQGLWHTLYDPVDPRKGAISMHRRVFADDLIHGTPRQWFSLFSTWHHDKALQDEFAKQIVLQRELQEADLSPVEEVALVVDDASFAWMPPESVLHRDTHPGLLNAMAQTGAPVGVWLLRDLEMLPDRIRLVVVGSAAAADREGLEALRHTISQGGRTVVLVGPVGLVDREAWRWRDEGPSELTGFPLSVSRSNEPGAPSVQAADGTCAERPLANGGRLIWRSRPPLDSSEWRQWMLDAGVHCFAPQNYSVHASKDLVSVTAGEGGNTRLVWPSDVSVRDVFTGWAGAGTTFDCSFEPGQTRLFHVEQSHTAQP